jgi:hypothetical protein
MLWCPCLVRFTSDLRSGVGPIPRSRGGLLGLRPEEIPRWRRVTWPTARRASGYLAYGPKSGDATNTDRLEAYPTNYPTSLNELGI